MSIIIKGVEMPEHCAMCGFHKRMDDPMISQHWCGISGKSVLNPYKNRADDCPLIEIPPHGRLIDADALLKSISRAIDDDPDIEDVYEEDYETVNDWLASAPTIIEAEEDE